MNMSIYASLNKLLNCDFVPGHFLGHRGAPPGPSENGRQKADPRTSRPSFPLESGGLAGKLAIKLKESAANSATLNAGSSDLRVVLAGRVSNRAFRQKLRAIYQGK